MASGGAPVRVRVGALVESSRVEPSHLTEPPSNVHVRVARTHPVRPVDRGQRDATKAGWGKILPPSLPSKELLVNEFR